MRFFRLKPWPTWALPQEVLDVPVSWISADSKGFDGLNVFGLGSGSLSYTFFVAEFDITVKGLI